MSSKFESHLKVACQVIGKILAIWKDKILNTIKVTSDLYNTTSDPYGYTPDISLSHEQEDRH